MDPTANNKGPSVAAPEAHSPTAGDGRHHADSQAKLNAPHQLTLADATGEPLPVDACFPDPTDAEAAARERVAGLMRDYGARHPGPFDVYDATTAAGWDLPAGCRGNAVMGPGVHLARLRGWVQYAGHDRKGTEPRTHAGRLRVWIGGAE